MFLVTSKDRHRDDDHWLYQNKDKALAKARKLANNLNKNLEVYVYPCDGKDGWWFLEGQEDGYEINVRELEMEDSLSVSTNQEA